MKFRRESFNLPLILLASFILSTTTTAYNQQYADEAKTVRLHWKSGAAIPISISSSLYEESISIRPGSDVEGAIRRSLRTWEKVANVEFVEISSDKQSVSPSGKSGDGVSLVTVAQTPENLVLFGNYSDEISARTRVFYNSRGNITEADIVLNPYQQFSTDGSIGTFDLEATLTHEIGHLLGLDHSSVIGATMQANQGKNGVYNLPSYASRTLAEDDIAGIRAIYGAKNTDENCCGSVSGKLLLANGKPAANFQVWVEDAGNGRVMAGVLTSSEGVFSIEGLLTGEYKIYAKDFPDADEKSYFSAEPLGKIEILQDKTTNLSKRLTNNKKDFELQYIGFNAQLSKLPVFVNSGNSYVIYLGGKNLDARNLIIRFSSPHIKVNQNSIIKHNFGKDISVISFEVSLSNLTPLGEYSFFVEKQNSTDDVLIGSLTVENFLNPWNSYFINVAR